jgi:hypothetical protein
MKTRIFPRDFLKISLIRNFMKIGPGGAELFHKSDRRDEANIGFLLFMNAPKKRLLSPSSPY